MKVAIIGSRNAKQFDIRRMEKDLPENCTLLLSGGAEGIDRMVEKFAKIKKIPIRVFSPDYNTHGKRAPLVRNTELVAAADEVIAYWDFRSHGTAFTIHECIRLGVPVRVIGISD